MKGESLSGLDVWVRVVRRWICFVVKGKYKSLIESCERKSEKRFVGFCFLI